MKFIIISIIVFVFNATSCSDIDLPKGTPSCIKSEIKKALRTDLQNPPIQIYQYDYNGEKVYLINSPCCDQFDFVYNSNCEKICAPYGGITGKGDNQCSDFRNKALNRTLVWKDERSAEN